MKNKAFKIFFSFVLFAFCISIKAGIEDKKCLNIKMISPGEPSHFDVKVPYCDWEFRDFAEVEGEDGTYFPSKDEAIEVGEEEIYVTLYEAAMVDEKGLVSGGGGSSQILVKRCDSPLAKVRVYYRCQKLINRLYHADSNNCCKNGKKNCLCGDDYHYCPDGYSERAGKCVSTIDGIEEIEKDGKFNKNNAEAKAGDGYTCRIGKYALLCPRYECIPKEGDISACAPEYTLEDDKEIFCVSPGLHFTSKSNESGYGRSKVQGYEIDGDFDYRLCTSSYVNEGCGYSNILIESEWMKKHGGIDSKYLDYQTINLAMRLYGAHIGGGGYDNVSGLGIYYGTAGKDNCDNMTAYFLTPSVYSITEEAYITEKYFNYITDKYQNTYLSPGAFLEDQFFDLSCNKLGLICHVNKTERNKHVRLALGLFFNTILGNEKMHEHVEDLYGVTVKEQINTSIVKDDFNPTKSRVITEYGDIHYEKIESGKVYDCNKLDEEEPELAARIRPYCQMKIVYKDSYGHTYDVIPESCTGKHSLRCTSALLPFATCDKDRAWQTVTYKYPGNKDIGPGRLISCDTPESNQFMYGIIDESIIEGDIHETDGDTTEETVYVDSIDCKKNITCTNTSLRTQDAKCSAPKSESEFNERDGEVVNGYVKDPSLKCILNASEEAKAKYDFSDIFGVNTNLCRVYCSDEVEYYIPDKVTVKNGRTFTYDIGIKSYVDRTDNRLLSNVVKEKRTCVSEIYYNNLPSNYAWDKIYGLTLDFIKEKNGGKNISSWMELYKVLQKATNKKIVINGKTFNSSKKVIKENLNELVYDLYNCNFFNESVFNTNKVTKPRQRNFGSSDNNDNIYKTYIKKEFSKDNAFGLHGGANNNNSNCIYKDLNGNLSCMNMENINYKGGSENIYGGRIGENTNESKVDLSNVSSARLSNIKYCRNNDSMNGSCFEYPEGTLYNSDYDLNSYNYETMDNKMISYDGKKIPVNDYALFSIITEVGFYNDSTFQAEPSNGKVKKIINKNNDSGRMVSDDYTYPVSKDAYSICDSSNYPNNVFYDPKFSEFSGTYKPKEYNNCRVEHVYKELNTYARVQFNDGFYNRINGVVPSCYYVVTPNPLQCPPGTTNCLKGLLDVGEYRNINRANMFPNGYSSYEKTNWDTGEGITVKSEIEDANTNIFTDDNYIEYSFELTPLQIKNIKSYNSKATSYIDVAVDNCEITKEKRYLNCRSVNGGLLDEIRKSMTDESNVSYATILNNHDGLDLIYNGK